MTALSYEAWRRAWRRARFVGWIADRYQGQARLKRPDALELAKVTLAEHLADEGVAFDGGRGRWTQAAAHELADADLEHWSD